jgi:hypothetical protein
MDNQARRLVLFGVRFEATVAKLPTRDLNQRVMGLIFLF